MYLKYIEVHNLGKFDDIDAELYPATDTRICGY